MLRLPFTCPDSALRTVAQHVLCHPAIDSAFAKHGIRDVTGLLCLWESERERRFESQFTWSNLIPSNSQSLISVHTWPSPVCLSATSDQVNLKSQRILGSSCGIDSFTVDFLREELLIVIITSLFVSLLNV